MKQVKRNQRHTNQAIIDKLREQSSATVHEVLGKRNAMLHTVKPIKKGMKVCGEALTVRTHAADNLMVIKAVSMLEEGQVLVIDSASILDAGPFGEVLAVECVAKKAAGLITDGSIRDSAEIADLEFPLFSAGISIRGTSKAAVGSINHDVMCGGVIVRAGDLILGDDDGVVVVPYEEVEEVVKKSIERDNNEVEVMKRLRNGESLFDIYGYQKTFDELNISEE